MVTSPTETPSVFSAPNSLSDPTLRSINAALRYHHNPLSEFEPWRQDNLRVIPAEEPSLHAITLAQSAPVVGANKSRGYARTGYPPSRGSVQAPLHRDPKKVALARNSHHYLVNLGVYTDQFVPSRRTSQDAVPTRPSSQTPVTNTSRTYLYPNPGHIGLTSHVAIFNQIFPDQSNNSPAAATGHSSSPNPMSPESPSLDDNPLARQGAELLKQLFQTYSLSSMESFVTFWIEKGINLPLAEPFVALCAKISNYSCLSTFDGPDWHLKLAQKLLANTTRPLEYDGSTSFAEYVAQFTGESTRWETLGIFLSAVLRASIEIPFFPTLYTTENSQRDLKNKLLALISCSLDVCLSLDCLNDLQHVIQYENTITYTYTSGDQSQQRH